ncbi:cupin domain-containing protein [Collimonas pratensis]|uniref:cupin domain-containing protein n=1 Tax=Collimonas pratensis TaxID=279113 RepID=UPI00143D35E4|nr:cupin domain-containing protein [Collimonas pratensis]NKI72419.1 cupin domain-containing protein [Collimonas pratensis]
MQIASSNLLTGLPPASSEEVFELLHQRTGLTIERIVSRGQASPPGFWYDNPQEEWVLLLSGSAGLTLEGASAEHVMQAGAWLHIPAHRRHRIEWTDGAQPTIWLAIHHDPGADVAA